MPLPNHDGLLEALRGRKFTDAEITTMSAEKMFREWCEWNGFPQWDTVFLGVIRAANRAAKIKIDVRK